MWKTMTLHSDGRDFEVILFLVEETGEWTDAMLEYNSIRDPDFPELGVCWDNTDFMFIHFLPFLYRWKEKTCSPTDKHDYSDVWDYFIASPETVDELIKVLEEAKNISNYGK